MMLQHLSCYSTRAVTAFGAHCFALFQQYYESEVYVPPL
jgi:hypothetical protein